MKKAVTVEDLEGFLEHLESKYVAYVPTGKGLIKDLLEFLQNKPKD